LNKLGEKEKKKGTTGFKRRRRGRDLTGGSKAGWKNFTRKKEGGKKTQGKWAWAGADERNKNGSSGGEEGPERCCQLIPGRRKGPISQVKM